MQYGLLAAGVILGFSAASSIHTNSPGRESWIMGAGNLSCAQFVQMYEGDPSLIEKISFSWTQGFMSAANQAAIAASTQPVNLVPEEWPVRSQMAFIRDYCASNPSNAYAVAALKLFEQLRAATSDSGFPR